MDSPRTPLPPCPICGKPDLFIGRDGKPGCPHCEVAVVLPDPPRLQSTDPFLSPDQEDAP